MIQWLDAVDQEDRDRLGVKAAGQGQLISTDTAVPRGFVVSPAFFRSYLQHHGIEERFDRLLHRQETDARQQIRSLIDEHAIPDELQEELGKHYDEINLSKGVRNAGSRALELIGGQREQDFVAVRASAPSPDTGCRPELCVNGKTSVGEAVRTLWKRYYSPPSVAVRDETDTDPTVLVQRMVEPEVSGTIYTRHPVTGEDELLVESIYGLGTPLYEGEASPDRHRIDRGSGALEERSVAQKDWKKVQDPSTGGIVRRRVPSDEKEDNTLDEQELRSLADDALEIEDLFSEPVRIDFAIGRNGLQVLDVKPLPDQPSRRGDTAGDGIQGIGISGGQLDARLVTSHDEDGIMVLESPSREKLARIPELEAWISPEDAISTNLAAASRRHGIPAAGGISPESDLHGSMVHLDGWDGTIQPHGSDDQTAPRQPDPTEQPQPDRRETPRPADRSPPGSATRVYVLGTEADGADGNIVRSSDGFGWASDPVLHRGDEDERMRFIDDYGAVFGDGPAGLVHLGALADAGSQDQALEAVRYLCDQDRECVVLVNSPDADLLQALVAAGIDGIATTGDSLDAVTDALDRAERRVLFDMLRDRR